MKLSEWAKNQGISSKTAWRWVRQGTMPVPFEQTPTGIILVKELEVTSRAVALDARVSRADQQADLDRHIARLVAYASEHGWNVTRVVSEIGAGLHGHRPKRIRLLSDPRVGTIIVDHRDRLMRFGFEDVNAPLAAQGRRMVVVEPGEVTDDLVQDMIEVLTSLCARRSGRRSARNTAHKALEAIERDG